MAQREVKIGVVGYCPPSKFDEEAARTFIQEAYASLGNLFPGATFTIVSGATNVGVLAIAYDEAHVRGWKTVGVACEKAKDYELFPVDELILEGENWGDESPIFVGMIDGIIKVGGGKQSVRETDEVRAAGKPSLVFDLPLLDAA